MVIEYVGRGFSADGSVRGYLERKLRKVLRFLDEPIEVRVVLEPEGHETVAEIHVSHRFGTPHTREAAAQVLDAVNLAVDNLETQAQRAHERFIDRRRRGDRAETAEGSAAQPAGAEPIGSEL